MKNLLAVTLLAVGIAVVGYLWVAPSAEGLPPCPCLEERYTTPGRTGTGATCTEAITDLREQLYPLIDCDYGSCAQQLFRNNCYLVGGSYQTDGWYQYGCQTNCYGEEEPPFP